MTGNRSMRWCEKLRIPSRPLIRKRKKASGRRDRTKWSRLLSVFHANQTGVSVSQVRSYPPLAFAANAAVFQRRLRTTHAVTAVVTEVAVTVSHGDAATVVATWCITLKASKLFAAAGHRATVLVDVDCDACSFQRGDIDSQCRLAGGCAAHRLGESGSLRGILNRRLRGDEPANLLGGGRTFCFFVS